MRSKSLTPFVMTPERKALTDQIIAHSMPYQADREIGRLLSERGYVTAEDIAQAQKRRDTAARTNGCSEMQGTRPLPYQFPLP